MTTAASSLPIAAESAATLRKRRHSLLAAAIAPLASLKLTVALFALSIFLIFAATLAQVDRGIWLVMEDYFKAPIAWIPLGLFVRGEAEVGGSIPMPGGVVLGAAMLVNLLAAHALRFRLKARGARLVAGLIGFAFAVAVIYVFHYVAAPHRLLVNNGLPVLFGLGALVYAPLLLTAAVLFGRRLGIVLVHASLILLIVGEGVSAYARHESQLVLREGQTASWAHDIRDVELAIIDPRPPAPADGERADASASPVERVVAIPASMLAATARRGGRLTHPELPFDVVVEAWFENAVLFHLPEDGSIDPMATAGVGLEAGVRPQPPASGVGDQRVNMPAAMISFVRDGAALGRYVVSVGAAARRLRVPPAGRAAGAGVAVGPSGRLDEGVAKRWIGARWCCGSSG